MEDNYNYVLPLDLKSFVIIETSEEDVEKLRSVDNTIHFMINLVEIAQKFCFNRFKKNLSSILSGSKYQIVSLLLSENINSREISQSKNNSYFISIHDITGYDFTSEYSHIYHGSIEPKSLSADTEILLEKAINSVTLSNFSSSIAKEVSKTVLQAFSLKLDSIDSTIRKSLSNKFPSVSELILGKESLRFSAQIFLEWKDNKLLFWLKILIPLDIDVSLVNSQGSSGSMEEINVKGYDIRCYDVICCQSDGKLSKSDDSFKILLSTKLFRVSSDIPKDTGSFNESVSTANSSPSSPRSMSISEDFGSSKRKRATEESSKANRKLNNASKSEKYPNVEVLGWGKNDNYSLGVYESDFVQPNPIILPVPAYLDPIKMIACGPHHSLILCMSGAMYACGNNSEGALGFGDTLSRAYFTLIPWAPLSSNEDKVKKPLIIKIAAGGGSVGSHSMAIDYYGSLYGWGVSYALGLSTLKTSLFPEKITLGMMRNNSTAIKVVDVSCGNCFTVALTSTGEVYSWGMWDSGRLGQGSVPYKANESNARNRKAAKYQLKPTIVKGIQSGIKVACGESHTLCLLQSGDVYAWGSNSYGQVGNGVSSAGFLKDAFSPRKIIFKDNDMIRSESNETNACGRVIIRNVFAGTNHSIAIDESGGVWSWGGRGKSHLGHGRNIIMEEYFSSHVERSFSLSLSSSIMIPYETLQWSRQWSEPRKIKGMKDLESEVVNVVNGETFTMMLTRDGDIYVCGSSYVIPPSKSSAYSANSVNGKEGASLRDEKNVMNQHSCWSIPRRLIQGWNNTTFESKRCLMIAGATHRVFALFDGDSISHSLMIPMYKRLCKGTLDDPMDVSIDGDDAQSVQTIRSLNDVLESSNDDLNKLIVSHGSCDCLIIVTGKILLAHKAIIASRCPGLRDMILSSSILDYDESNSSNVMKLLIPEWNSDTATSVLYFIYTDSLPSNVIRSSTIITALKDISAKHGMTRLHELCEVLIKANTALELSRLGFSHDDDTIDAFNIDRPNLTLKQDLNSLVGDPQFADIVFLVEEKSLYAHRFILESRSNYFRTMFSSGMSESVSMKNSFEGRQNQLIDVVVPDSYIGMLRMLIYIYTDKLPSALTEMLLEDLIMADRYSVVGMKRLCEAMIQPSPDTWTDILIVAEIVNSSYLLEVLKDYLLENISLIEPLMNLTSTEQFNQRSTSLAIESDNLYNELKRRSPKFLDDLIIAHRQRSISTQPSSLLRDYVKTSADLRQTKLLTPVFPITVIPLLLLTGITYYYTSSMVVLGWIVPVINGVCVVGLIMFGIYKLDVE